MPNDDEGSGHLEENTRMRLIESEKSDPIDLWKPDHRARSTNLSDFYRAHATVVNWFSFLCFLGLIDVYPLHPRVRDLH